MISKPFAGVAVVLGILIVGLVDHLSGTEIRVFPLYFLPLIPAAWVFGRTGAVSGSLLATGVWAATLFVAGRPYSQSYIWVINCVTQGVTFLVVSLLIAGLHKSLQRERFLSSSDALTGLANRHSFYTQAGIALALCHRSRFPVSLAYIDLDNFKQVNDRHGHDSGDALLRRVGEILMSSLRTSDIAARVGGDEFVVVLPDTTAETARVVLEKIRTSLAEAPELRGFSVTASIGAVSYAQAPSDVTVMMKAADEIMYRVKESEKGGIQVHSAIAA
jgi:diguanylate cyclase (GGDEF)-like protein